MPKSLAEVKTTLYMLAMCIYVSYVYCRGLQDKMSCTELSTQQTGLVFTPWKGSEQR